MGGAGDSRYQFCGGCSGKIWSGGAGYCDHGQAGPRAVDCASFVGYGNGSRRKGENSVAVVYRLILLAAVCKTYLPAGAGAYSLAVKVAKIGLDGNAVFDRQRYFCGDDQERGTSSTVAGNYLWLIVLTGTLWLIRIGWIRL